LCVCVCVHVCVGVGVLETQQEDNTVADA
jgi:hypothetical protein